MLRALYWSSGVRKVQGKNGGINDTIEYEALMVEILTVAKILSEKMSDLS